MNNKFAAFYGTKDQLASHLVLSVGFGKENDETLKQYDRVYAVSEGRDIGFILAKKDGPVPAGKEKAKSYRFYRRTDRGSLKYSIDSARLAVDLALNPVEVMKYRYGVSLQKKTVGSDEIDVLVIGLDPISEKTRQPKK